MKSPYTGKEMICMKENREIVFRKESFDVVFHFWKCTDSGEQFTDAALDEINLGQAYNQFRSKHKLPFPEEIQAIREQYKLSASRMSEILGFGVNVYRQYESGEIPSESNARLIQMARDPLKFQSLLDLCSTIDEKSREKVLQRITFLLQTPEPTLTSTALEQEMFGHLQPDEFTGFRRPNLLKINAMVLEFAKAMNPWKTKLNKLLFYADFVHFSKTCRSISGLRYDAIQFGPVPHNYNGIYQLLASQNTVSIEYIEYPNGSIGERFHAKKSEVEDVLDPTEHATVLEVVSRFQKSSNQSIVFESHLEAAWKQNVDQPQPAISYLKYAFDLVHA